MMSAFVVKMGKNPRISAAPVEGAHLSIFTSWINIQQQVSSTDWFVPNGAGKSASQVERILELFRGAGCEGAQLEHLRRKPQKS
jgi:hypothetical protein